MAFRPEERSEVTLRAAAAVQRRTTLYWIVTVVALFAAATAGLDGELAKAAGFGAISGAFALQAARLVERNRAWWWLTYLLLGFSIALFVVRVVIRARGGGAA